MHWVGFNENMYMKLENISIRLNASFAGATNIERKVALIRNEEKRDKYFFELQMLLNTHKNIYNTYC